MFSFHSDYNNVLSVLSFKPFNGTMVSVQKLPKTTSFQLMDAQCVTDQTLGNMMLRRIDGITIITLEDEEGSIN